MELIDRIIRQNPWWEGKKVEGIDGLKPRKLFKEVLMHKRDKQIISLVGLRRVGKTTIIYQLIESLLNETNAKRVLYFSFDELLGKEPEIIEEILQIYEEEILKEELKGVYIFFDEISHVSDWQIILKRWYDVGGIKFFVSGSASTLLKKAKESLAGRIYEFELKPLSFEEYLHLKDVKINDLATSRLTIRRELNNYLLNGAFPEVINEADFGKIGKYVSSIIEKVIFYDLPKLYDIGEPEILRGIFGTIAAQPGMLLEYQKLASTFRISYQTASKYVSYLEKAFLIRLLYNYRGSPIARARKAKKAYLAANALALPFITESDYLKLLPKLVENLVVTQLDAKFFWREYYEVDILDRSKNLPIEVKYGERSNFDIKGQLQIAKKLKSNQLLIITKDTEEEKLIDEIKVQYVPLWKFLLKPYSLLTTKKFNNAS